MFETFLINRAFQDMVKVMTNLTPLKEGCHVTKALIDGELLVQHRTGRWENTRISYALTEDGESILSLLKESNCDIDEMLNNALKGD